MIFDFNSNENQNLFKKSKNSKKLRYEERRNNATKIRRFKEKEKNMSKNRPYDGGTPNITMQIAAGVPIVTVAGRAGHARTSTTTDIYSHFLKTADRSAAQKIEEIFE